MFEITKIICIINHITCTWPKEWRKEPRMPEKQITIAITQVPYFFSYKREFISFLNNHKDLDLSYKTDLDLRDC